MSQAELRAAIAAVPFWYHSIELGPGIVTPGYWDTRQIVGRLPWPEVRGKRCLDVGTADGFLAFELERRGAAEVLALDVADPSKFDWPPDARESGPERLSRFRAPGNPGFHIACDALGSSVEYREMTVYELDPQNLGKFDVVVCGSVLLNLRDPLRALEAIRSVCTENLLSMEAIDLWWTLRSRRPIAQLHGSGADCRWWHPNAAGHRRMLFAAGFDVERTIRPYLLALGQGARTEAPLRTRITQRIFGGGTGVTHAAVLARPRSLGTASGTGRPSRPGGRPG